MASLVLTDISQLTSDSQHLGFRNIFNISHFSGSWYLKPEERMVVPGSGMLAVHLALEWKEYNPSQRLVHFLTAKEPYKVSLYEQGQTKSPAWDCGGLATPEYVVLEFPGKEEIRRELEKCLIGETVWTMIRNEKECKQLNILADKVSKEEKERYVREILGQVSNITNASCSSGKRPLLNSSSFGQFLSGRSFYQMAFNRYPYLLTQIFVISTRSSVIKSSCGRPVSWSFWFRQDPAKMVLFQLKHSGAATFKLIVISRLRAELQEEEERRAAQRQARHSRCAYAQCRNVLPFLSGKRVTCAECEDQVCRPCAERRGDLWVCVGCAKKRLPGTSTRRNPKLPSRDLEVFRLTSPGNSPTSTNECTEEFKGYLTSRPPLTDLQSVGFGGNSRKFSWLHYDENSSLCLTCDDLERVGANQRRSNTFQAEEMYLHLREGRVENHFGETTLSTTEQDSSLGLPVIGSLVYCETSALDHAATEACLPLN
uniref:FYVE-type zinc finger domain-containing protein n=1 Tax=Timema shepardi TaxID=629360 RepID=A0A7R9ATW8_TIMSH|nr:unnamed protein product [Timema shepardi]